MQISRKIREKLSMDTPEKVFRVGIQQGMIIVGGLLSALGYVVFQIPYKIAAGGVSGLGIIVNELTGFPAGIFFLVANIPLFILGFRYLGRWQFIWSSIVAVLVFSIATELLTSFMPLWIKTFPLTENALLACIYAGILYGIGTGLIYRYGGTVGGTSVIARIIYNKTGFPLSQSYLFSDMTIILLAGFMFNMEIALLATITLMLFGLFSDYMLEGTSQSRVVMIITEHPKFIRDAIMYELKRGVSHWDVTGGFSGKQRTMLYLTVLRSKIYDVKYIVSRLDPDAFMVVGVSQQVWGGYNAPKISKK